MEDNDGGWSWPNRQPQLLHYHREGPDRFAWARAASLLSLLFPTSLSDEPSRRPRRALCFCSALWRLVFMSTAIYKGTGLSTME